MKSKLWIHILTAVVFLMIICAATAYTKETDEQIEDAAKNSYVFKNYLKDDHVQVHSENGIVVLTGTVEDANHKSLAGAMVGELSGVERVDNQIKVEGKEYPKNSDAWLAFKAKSALLFHRNVSVINTSIDIKDGIATITGQVENQAQKDLTEEYIKDIDGIKDVKNELMIVPANNKSPNGMDDKRTWNEKMGDTIDDASITAQVKLALLWNGSTSGMRTGVKTHDGVVELTGKANNGAEIDLATKLASDINGVKTVVNRMSVTQ